ncbi:uncharacterized protein LY89DRAFT_739760 [Mollisia scopiformis]|uniref:Uncharacterized protein n=1 Tax=Mollisia scopiformis TaxID=149040 RepID=A0A194WS14_MOLSC|nr:uncharacterized protein LY89DRAFT_739760 [Mollisia scopiformis]KUJ10770.1 hypothetical protein LY89DRAFT_739760 [Mollisia scopiformis]
MCGLVIGQRSSYPRWEGDRPANCTDHTATQPSPGDSELVIQPQDRRNNTLEVRLRLGEEELYRKEDYTLDQYSNPYHLYAIQILDLRKSGQLPRLPYITLEEIKDKSKSDSMIRVIAILQILWTTIQIIARAIRNLAISQLEIAVLAFAVCAIFTYVLNWSKPKAVQVPFTILQYNDSPPAQMLFILTKDVFSLSNWFLGFMDPAKGDGLKLGAPPFNSNNLDKGDDTSGLATVIGSVVFGGLHLAAWNFAFPTEIERTL